MKAIHSGIMLELRTKSLWLLSFLGIGLVTSLIGVSPLGISTQTPSPVSIIEASFLGGLAGCTLAVMHLAQLRVPLTRAPRPSRLKLELAAITTGTIFAAIGAAAPLAVASADRVQLLPLVLLLAHLAATGLVFARLPMRPITVVLAMPLITWIVQAFIGPNDPRAFVRLLRTMLDPTQNGTIVSYAEPLGTPLLAAIAPILGLLGLRAALDSLDQTPSKQ